MDAGWAGFRRSQETGEMPDDLIDIMEEWNDPDTRANRPNMIPFVSTDIVGSTQLTQKYGNSKAQKLIRTHNAIVRSAIRDFSGEELKHTGDGILSRFGTAAEAAKAAVQIQQMVFDNNRDEEELQLFVRIGVHLGEAVLEDGEYYGSGVMTVDGICGAAEDGEILCSKPLHDNAQGAGLSFIEVGMKSLKGMKKQQNLFRIHWEPTFRHRKSEINYRQIGSMSG